MALITSKTIITSIALFHLTVAYFFMVNPAAISDQAIVYILGESMGLPSAQGFDSGSPALSLLAVVLGIFGLTDLVSLSMPEELAALYYWGTQAPLRFCIAMGSVFYSYAFSPSSILYNSTSRNTSYNLNAGGFGGLKNRVFFSFMFMEMISWFWVWITLREERASVVEKLRKQHARHD